MMTENLFQYQFLAASRVDIGAKRPVNQDEVICCPEYGFFAVSDGMGGLDGGKETSAMIAEALPGLIGQIYEQLRDSPAPEQAATLLAKQVALISDNIDGTMNGDDDFAYGATVCGVWLVGKQAVFVNLGDSRGYLLKADKEHIEQITLDHNMAVELVAEGRLFRDQARQHWSSSVLTRFVGMEAPALPETFIAELEPGDRILLCSDGLHGMIEDADLPGLLRASDEPEQVVNRLIDEANRAGGRDNIAVVYIKIME
jgi:serine/threonine protein phosphatase PrpC